MVAVFCIQRSAVRKNIYGLKQLIQVPVLLLCQLQVFLKLICEFDLVLYASSAALRSSILV